MKKLLILLVALFSVAGVIGCTKTFDNDTLVVAIGDGVKNLDPATGDDALTHYVGAQIYEGLYSYDAVGNLRNELAKSVVISPDKLTYTYEIIDAYWSNGTKITADQFEFGAKRSLNYGVEDAYYSSFIYGILAGTDTVTTGTPIEEMDAVGVKAIDDNHIEYTLVQPTPYFEQLLVQKVYYPVLKEFATLGESTWANSPEAPSSGAFKIVSYDAQHKVVLEKNNAWRNASQVSLKKIEYIVMEEDTVQQAAFNSKEIDFAMHVPTEVNSETPGYYEMPAVINYFVTINATGQHDKSGFKPNTALYKTNVRLALLHATNQNEVIEYINAGSLFYPLYGLVPKGIAGKNGADFRSEADATSTFTWFDLNLAKSLLATEGYTSAKKLEIEYFTNSNTRNDAVAQVLKEQWEATGLITVSIRNADTQTFFTDRTYGDFQVARHANSADYLDPTIYLSMYYGKTLGANDIIGDPEYDKLYEAANKLEGNARIDALHAAETYFVQTQGYIIPIYGYSEARLKQAYVGDIEKAPDGSVLFRYTTKNRTK